MSQILGVGVSGFFLILPLVLAFWERREMRDLGPLVSAGFLGSLAGGVSLACGNLPALMPVVEHWRGAAASLGVLAMVAVLGLVARWPRVETPLDVTWTGVVLGAGAGVVAGFGALAGRGAPWLGAAFLATGSLLGGLWGFAWLVGKSWGRLALGGVVLATAAVSPRLWVYLSAFESWTFSWMASLSLVALAVGAGLWAEEKVLGPQLAEEAAFGLLPPWAARRGSRFWQRFSKTWAGRRDERKAIVRLVVRLGACKAYLAAQGKHRSTAAVELGRLRERARRLFSANTEALES